MSCRFLIHSRNCMDTCTPSLLDFRPFWVTTEHHVELSVLSSLVISLYIVAYIYIQSAFLISPQGEVLLPAKVSSSDKPFVVAFKTMCSKEADALLQHLKSSSWFHSASGYLRPCDTEDKVGLVHTCFPAVSL